MLAKLQRWRDNPVFVKEMRVGFREKKVFLALSTWIILLALVTALFTAFGLADSRNISELPETGKYLFETLFWMQLVLLAMLSPALTTSAVSGERERQSFEMLMTTHLSPAELIFGKLGFAASFLGLALFSTIPLESLVFFLGGVSLSTFLVAKLLLLLFGLLAGLLGLMLSARESRSAYATGQTYMSLLLLCIVGIPFLSVLRYTPDLPWQVITLALLTSIYLLFFFFWKSVNHLEERASHLMTILRIGLGFYIAILAVTLSSEKFWGDLNDSMWVFWAPVHYFLMGIFLNPGLPERRRERELYQKSRWSRPSTWVFMLSLGILLPNLYGTDTNFGEMSLYTLMASFGTGVFARGLSMKHPSRFPVTLGGLWLALNIIPPFFALAGLEASDKSYHPAFISPLMFLISGYDHSWDDFAILALVFYAVLALVGIVLCLKKRA